MYGISRLLIALSFLNFAVYLILSNHFDWDQFYAFLEVDRRGWLHSWGPASWSYQLCAGASRIADPQSFTLSPFFIFPLAFGPVIGSKVLILFAAIIGYLFTRKIFSLFLDQSSDLKKLIFLDLLPLLYIFSGYYLAHFHFGHLTFINFYIFSIPTYFCLKIIFATPSNKDYWLCGLSIFCIMIGGFYHSFVFWWVPFSLAIGIYLLITREFQTLLKLLKPLSIFFLLSSYKLIHVYFQQKSFPRLVSSDSLNESNTIWQIFKVHFLPVTNFDSYIFGFKHDQSYSILENTAFSIAPYLIIFLALIAYKSISKIDKKFLLLIFSIFIVFLGLSFGNFHDLSPFALLNKLLFSDSVRVVGRFNVGVTFALFLLIVAWGTHLRPSKAHFYGLASLVLAINCYFYIPFFTTNFAVFKANLNAPTEDTNKMQNLMIVPKTTLLTHYNYLPTKKGFPILNCYNPIGREEVTWKSLGIESDNQTKVLPLIFESEKESRACIQNTYLTHDSIVISKACSPDICLNVNSVSSDDWEKGFRLNKKKMRYCRKRNLNP